MDNVFGAELVAGENAGTSIVRRADFVAVPQVTANNTLVQEGVSTPVLFCPEINNGIVNLSWTSSDPSNQVSQWLIYQSTDGSNYIGTGYANGSDRQYNGVANNLFFKMQGLDSGSNPITPLSNVIDLTYADAPIINSQGSGSGYFDLEWGAGLAAYWRVEGSPDNTNNSYVLDFYADGGFSFVDGANYPYSRILACDANHNLISTYSNVVQT